MKKRILSILAIGLVMVNVNATTITPSNEKGKKESKITASDKDSKASVKYIGEAKENGIVFDVDFNNPSGDNFLLVITNNQGDDLYNRVFSGSNFHRTIMIKKDSDSEGKVIFTLRNKGNDIYSKTFSIDTETRVLRNLVVKSVN